MVDLLIYLAASLAGMAFILAMIRFVIGPGVSDRIVAFDVVTIVAITVIIITALEEDRVVYLDVALVYALLSFLGVIVVARYLERGF
ncbi:MAG: cation:proton antiporter [Magnetococcales bacterium]|nr:cation:proton antiporter [Magnetococcales bacterium]